MKYYFRCPKCGNDEEFVKPSEEIAGLGFPTYILGGLFLVFLFSEHLRLRVLCVRCNHIFRPPPPPKSALTRFAGALGIVTILFVSTGLIAMAMPDSGDALPELSVLLLLEEAIRTQPRIVAYFITLLVAAILILSWITAWVSNTMYRKELSKHYLLKPGSRPAQEMQSPVGSESESGVTKE